MKKNKTSLEKSHSSSSNALLTLICLLTTFSTSIFWIGLGSIFVKNFPSLYSYLMLGSGGVLTLISLLFLSRFKR